MRPCSFALGLMGVVISSYGCKAQVFDDPFTDYLHRGVTISVGAGNAADANAAIQTIDPWPPYVGNTHIPGDGRGMVGAVERMYKTPDPFGSAGGSSATSSPTGTSTSITSTSTPMQPISSGY
jgi:hypothetical protein